MKRVQILNDVSMEIPEGSIFGFLGANGAGKTSLIQLIAGIRKPTTGTVTIRGIDTTDSKARSRLGYLPERPYFYEHLTGQEFLEYLGVLSGLDVRNLKSKITTALSRVGLSSAAKLRLKNYSKGMLQRIGVAQAILHDPEFVLLDEPMSGLDPVGRKEIRDLILELKHEGRTVFFSSHVIPDVESLCDRVGLIKKGKLIGSGVLSDFFKEESRPVEVGFTLASPSEAFKLQGLVRVEKLEGLTHRGWIEDPTLSGQVIEGLLKKKAVLQWMTPKPHSLEELFK
jgi:ABC-2 type transport system ATP-binding protein